MKNFERVTELLTELRTLAESDFELHRLEMLERDLIAPPTVEIIDDSHQKFCGITFNKRKDEHYAKHALPLHRAVWQYHHGEIPDGYEIHHVDKNPANNAIDNLQCLSKVEHREIHKGTFCHSVKRLFVCEVCGKTYEAFVTGTNRYCSPECNWKANHAKRKSIKKICEHCGCEYTTRLKGQKFCSKKCSAQAHRIKKICPTCGKEFFARRSKIIYCSVDCARKSKRKRIKKICPICGKEFETRINDDYKTCSTECRYKLMSQTLHTREIEHST